MRLKLSVFSVIVFFTIVLNCSGKILEGKGKTVFPFLKINPSVKSSGFAGSSAATMEGIQAIYLNPAGIAAIKSSDFYAQYTRWFDEINIGYMSIGKLFSHMGVLGVSIGYIQYPKQKETIIDTDSPYNYSVKDSFSASTVFTGTYISKTISKSMLGGFGVKLVGQKIGEFKSVRTFAFDTGIIAKSPPYATYGISLNNLSWGAKYGKDWEPLPCILRIGGEWKHISRDYRKWQYSFKLCTELRYNDGLYINGGLEVIPYKFLSFRAGYTYALESDDLGGIGGASFGLGLLKIGSMDIEYALSSFGRLGFTHRFALTWRTK